MSKLDPKDVELFLLENLNFFETENHSSVSSNLSMRLDLHHLCLKDRLQNLETNIKAL